MKSTQFFLNFQKNQLFLTCLDIDSLGLIRAFKHVLEPKLFGFSDLLRSLILILKDKKNQRVRERRTENTKQRVREILMILDSCQVIFVTFFPCSNFFHSFWLLYFQKVVVVLYFHSRCLIGVHESTRHFQMFF